MSTTTKSTSLTVIDKFAGLANAETMQAAISENLGDEGFSPLSLDRIRMPSGGGISWEVPTMDGDTEPVKALEGVIVYWNNVRTLWPEGNEVGSGEPPACRSNDGKLGIGTPGGDCSKCPKAQWASGKNGGQACKLSRLVFLLREDDVLPIVVRLSPGSLKAAKDYGMRLSSKALVYRHVITSITLKKETNKTGIVYSQAGFQFKGLLSPELKAKADVYHDQIKAAADAVAKLAAEMAEAQSLDSGDF